MAFWDVRLMRKDQVEQRLSRAGEDGYAAILRGCTTKAAALVCIGCHAVKRIWNRCDKLWCPMCQHALSKRRMRNLGEVGKFMKNPTHLVLTARNSETITAARVREFKSALGKLRRSKLFRNVKGGLYSIEVTNEGKGWHLHLHLLIDSEWIDKAQLQAQWGSYFGQDYAICNIKRSDSYLKEVVKYTVKGSELAKWSGEDVAAFIRAFERQRTFGTFGNVFKQRAEWKAVIEALDNEPQKCECGCAYFKVLGELECETWLEMNEPTNVERPRREPVPPSQLSLSV